MKRRIAVTAALAAVLGLSAAGIAHADTWSAPPAVAAHR